MFLFCKTIQRHSTEVYHIADKMGHPKIKKQNIINSIRKVTILFNKTENITQKNWKLNGTKNSSQN